MKTLFKSLSIALLFSTVMVSHVFAAEHEIKMLNNGADGIMVFEPAFLKVEVGDTVKFLSTDVGHNTVSFFTPEGATSWESPMSKDHTVTIDKEGIYIYDCAPHLAMAMVGVIQAGAPTNLDAAKKAAAELSAKFVMNQGRLDKYMEQVK